MSRFDDVIEDDRGLDVVMCPGATRGVSGQELRIVTAVTIRGLSISIPRTINTVPTNQRLGVVVGRYFSSAKRVCFHTACAAKNISIYAARETSKAIGGSTAHIVFSCDDAPTKVGNIK